MSKPSFNEAVKPIVRELNSFDFELSHVRSTELRFPIIWERVKDHEGIMVIWDKSDPHNGWTLRGSNLDEMMREWRIIKG